MQKLEEVTFEILDQLQQLSNQMKQKSLNTSIEYNKDDNSGAEEQLHKQLSSESKFQRPRPYLRRRMFSECQSVEKNDEHKHVRRNSFKSNSTRDNKVFSKSTTKVDHRADIDSTQSRPNLTSEMDARDSIINELINNGNTTTDVVQKVQPNTSLDQCTLHPFVYLQPVVKPPINEYTSITDCIDTTDVDRPPSPPVTFLSTLSTVQKDNPFSYLPTREANEYCATETVRSTIARQESEMLLLAEESEHVIYTQMLNKMIKKPGKRKKLVKTGNTDNAENTSRKASINEDDNKCEAKNDADEVFSLEFSDDKSLDNDHVIDDDNLTPLCSKNRNNNEGKSLLNENHRNSSQIWYVQSEADVLCLDLDEDENTNC